MKKHLLKYVLLFVLFSTMSISSIFSQLTASFDYYYEPSTDEVSFYDMSTGLPNQWEWDFGDGNTSTDQYPVYSYTGPGTYNVCLTVTNTITQNTDVYCADVEIPDNTGLVANFDYYATGPSVSFYDMSTGPVGFWSWDFGDGTSASEQNPVHTYTGAGTYNVCLTVYDTNYEILNTHCADVIVDEPGGDGPVANFDTYVSANRNVDFFNMSTGNVTSWSWDFGDGNSSNQQNPSHQYTLPGTYNVCLTAYDIGSGNNDTYCADVVVTLIAGVTADYNFTTSGLRAYFSDLSTGTITVWAWDFGDGNASIEQNPTHTYTAPGTYNVCLTVANGTGSTDNICYDVTVSESGSGDLIADFEFFPGGIQGAFSFSDLSTGAITSWSWDFGDGNTSILQEPDHVYSIPGTYNVCLTVSDNAANTANICQPVVYSGFPGNMIADFNFSPGLLPGVYTFDDFSTGLITIWAWTFGDGATSNLRNPEHRYTAPGTYNVCLTVSDGGANSDNICYELIFDESGSGDVTADFDFYPGILPGVYSFDDFSTGPITSWAWDFGDGGTSNLQYPEHRYSAPGTYNVCLTVQDRDSNTDNICHTLTMNSSGSGDLIADFDFTRDIGTGTFYFDDLSIGDITSWHWNFDDGSSSSTQDPDHDFRDPGLYNVCLRVSDASGNSNQICRSIFVGTNNELIADFDYNVIDASSPVSFFDLSTGNITTWAWEFGDGRSASIQDPTHIFDEPGMYNVCLTVSNSSGDRNNICYPVNVFAQDQLQASFIYDQVSGENTIFFGDNSTGPADQWIWDFGDGATGNGQFVEHEYSRDGTYKVCLRIRNTSSNDEDFYCQNVTVSQGEGVNAMYSYYINQTQLQANFKDNSTGDITEWYWDFGDGNSSLDPNPSHIYSRPGIYPVCLMVVDNASGSDDFYCENIEVFNNISDIFADFDYIFNGDGLSVEFKNLSLGKGLKYHWDFGDGEISNLANPIHIYTSPGDYRVCLEAVNPLTGAEDFVCINIFIEGSQLLIAQYDFFVNKETNTVTFKNTSMGDYTTASWDFGDGTNSTEINPVHTFKERGNYDVCLKIGDNAGANSSVYCDFVSLQEENELVANFDFFYDVETKQVKVDNLSLGKITNYFWDFGDGAFSEVESPKTHTYEFEGIYTICLYIANDNTGNYAQHCVEVPLIKNSFGLLNADFKFFIDNSTNTVSFTNTSKGIITEQFWDFGNGQFSESANPEISFKKGIYDVCLFVMGASGAFDEICKQVVIKGGNGIIVPDFTWFVDPSTKNVNFIDNSSGDITNWYWEFGDNEFSTQQNTMHTYTKNGDFNVCLNLRNTATGINARQCHEISVNSGEINAGYSFFVEKNSKKVTFSNKSTGDITHYYWDFGDDDFSEEKSPVHSYARDGAYEVCLTVFNEKSGMLSFYCDEITVRSSSQVELNADFSYFVMPETNEIIFEDKSIGDITNWYWVFCDGNFSEEQSPTHKYTTAGTREVCLTASNPTTGKKAKACKLIQVGEQKCRIHADFEFVIDNNSNTIYLTDRSTGNIADWYWDFGDSQTENGNTNIKHTYNSPGEYVVSLSVIDKTGNCHDYAEVTVQIGSLDCKARFEYEVFANKNQVSLTNLSKGNIDSYYWDFGDGSNSNDASPTHTYKAPGLYEIALVVSDNQGFCDDIYHEQVQVGTVSCDAGFTVYIEKATSTATFKNNEMGQFTELLWEFGDGSFSSEANPTHKYLKTGYFTVSLTTFNEAVGCIDYEEKNILISEIGIDCQADFVFQIENTTARFFDRSSGKITKRIWDFNDETTSSETNPVHGFAEGKNYNVCLTVFNDKGLSSTICKNVSIKASCFADFNFTTDILNKSAKFIDKSKGDIDSWNWQFGDANTAAIQNPKHTYDQPGFYSVILSVESSANKCKSRVMKIVNISDISKLFADFAFTLRESALKSGGYPADFISSSFGKPARAIWDFGDGTTDSLSLSPTHTYSKSGDYNVCLIVSDPNTGEKSEVTCKMVEIGDIISVDGPLADINVNENSQDQVFDISKVFTSDKDLTITIESNSNESLVTATLEGSQLTLSFAENSFGEATISIKATAEGFESTDEFTVSVIEVDMPPILIGELKKIMAEKNDDPFILDLSPLFKDEDSPGEKITFEVTSSNQELVVPTLDGTNLSLIYMFNKTGSADITIKAISGQTSADFTFQVEVGEGSGIGTTDELTFSISPNPNKGVFKLVFNASDPNIQSIEIYSILGEKVYAAKHFVSNIQYINAGNLRPNMYMVKIVAGDKQFIRKLIIED